MIIVRITETKRVENMPSNWYKVYGKDRHQRAFEVDESQMPFQLKTGDFVSCRELGDGKLMALQVVEGF